MRHRALKQIDRATFDKCAVLRFIGFRDHTKPDGSTVTLTLFERFCRNCQQPFECSSSVNGEIAIDVSRLCVRCPECRGYQKLKPEGEQP